MSSTQLSVATVAIALVGAVAVPKIVFKIRSNQKNRIEKDFEETQRTVDQMMANRAENAYCITTL